MTDPPATDRRRRTTWLPSIVFGLFALVLGVDIAVVAFYGSYHELVEDDGLSIGFTPGGSDSDRDGAGAVELRPDSPVVDADGRLLVEAMADGIAVYAPGELTVRFRSPHAGAFVVVPYDFGDARPRATCEVSLARIPSAQGLDTINRRKIKAGRSGTGRYRQYLADHAGWFQLSLRLDREAVSGGFRIGRPEIVFD